MPEKHTTILMAKLASYDKYHAAADKKKAEYFRHDYVYRQNMATRFFVLIGSVLASVIYFVHQVIINGLDLLDIDQVAVDLIRVGVFVLLMQMLYTLIGVVVHTKEYNEAQERINVYIDDMQALAKQRQPERESPAPAKTNRKTDREPR